MKKSMPVLVFLMMLLLSPTISWAEDSSDAGGDSEASVEQVEGQTAVDKVKKAKKAKEAKEARKDSKKSGKAGEEEPDCE